MMDSNLLKKSYSWILHVRWERKIDAMDILDSCGFHPEIGIKVLIQKSLITIDSVEMLGLHHEIFGMHDLVQEMGHYIVRGEHPNNPEKHSRVWKKAEVRNMCFGDATVENHHIEAIEFDDDIDQPHVNMLISKMKKLRWLRRLKGDNRGNGEAINIRDDIHRPKVNMLISKLKKLRCLCLEGDNVENVEAPNFLSNELRYIEWNNYPASPFPKSFQATNLVFLKLECSQQKLLWKGYKHLPQLKVLQLESLERLVSTPDFNGLPNLQKLELWECEELEEIHPSLGNHRSLKSVHVSFCSKLRKFPTIVRMEQLESLHISYCGKSLDFPEIQANMECLVKLDVRGIQIDALLSSIGERCTNLISISLLNCISLNSFKVKFDGLKCLKEFKYYNGRKKSSFPLPLTRSLRKLDLSSCYFEDGEIQSDIGELSNLQDLDLSGNYFSKLDFSLSQLTRLKRLKLSGCKRLVKFPELPSSIAIILADGCYELATIGNLSENCKWLCYISLCQSTVIDGNGLLQSMLKGNAIQNQSMHLRIRGLEIPNQFTNRLYAGHTCRLPLLENWCNDFCGFLISAFLVDHEHSRFLPPSITIEEEASDDMRGMLHDVVWKESFGGKLTWVCYVSFDSLRRTEWWNPTHKNVSFYIDGSGFTCIGIGASLVPMNNGSRLTDTSTDSSELTDDYTTKIYIHRDSKSSLTICPDV